MLLSFALLRSLVINAHLLFQHAYGNGVTEVITVGNDGKYILRRQKLDPLPPVWPQSRFLSDSACDARRDITEAGNISLPQVIENSSDNTR
jgi:hypothetical protein